MITKIEGWKGYNVYGIKQVDMLPIFFSGTEYIPSTRPIIDFRPLGRKTRSHKYKTLRRKIRRFEQRMRML